jgi:hypothetical protein
MTPPAATPPGRFAAALQGGEGQTLRARTANSQDAPQQFDFIHQPPDRKVDFGN